MFLFVDSCDVLDGESVSAHDEKRVEEIRPVFTKSRSKMRNVEILLSN